MCVYSCLSVATGDQICGSKDLWKMLNLVGVISCILVHFGDGQYLKKNTDSQPMHVIAISLQPIRTQHRTTCPSRSRTVSSTRQLKPLLWLHAAIPTCPRHLFVGLPPFRQSTNQWRCHTEIVPGGENCTAYLIQVPTFQTCLATDNRVEGGRRKVHEHPRTFALIH